MRRPSSRSVVPVVLVLVVPYGLLGCDAAEPNELDPARVRDCSLLPARQVMNLGTLEQGRSQDRRFTFGPSDANCRVETFELRSVAGDVDALRVEGVATGEPVAWTFDGDRAVVPFTVTGLRPGRHRVELDWALAGPDGASVQRWTLEIIATVEARPGLLVRPDTLSFGVTCPGDRRTLMLENPAATSIQVDRIEAGEGFTIDASLPFEVLPGDSRAVDVQFVPSEVGDFAATVEIESRVDGEARQAAIEVEATVAAGAPRSQIFEVQDGMAVDLVIVVDPSALGRRRRQNEAGLEAVLDGFLQDPRVIDFRVALTTSDMDGAAGRFYPLDGTSEDRIITRRSDPDPGAHLRRLLDRVEVSDAPNRVLDAVYAVFTPPLIGAENGGFLRRGPAIHGALAVTERADESEPPVEFFINFLISIKGFCGSCDEFVTFASASGGEGGCMSADGGVAEPAPRLTQMASWLDGVTAPICQRDWGSTFASFPSFPERRVREPTRFILDANPDSGSLQVEVDGERYDAEEGRVWLYDPTEREVVFTPRGRPLPGSSVEMSYWTGCRGL